MLDNQKLKKRMCACIQAIAVSEHKQTFIAVDIFKYVMLLHAFNCSMSGEEIIKKQYGNLIK